MFVKRKKIKRKRNNQSGDKIRSSKSVIFPPRVLSKSTPAWRGP